MDQTSLNKKRVTILSNIVLSSQSRSTEASLGNSEIIDLTEDDTDIAKESAISSNKPQNFKNLLLELPVCGLDQKTQQDFSVMEQCPEKIKKENDENKSCDEEVEIVFNYMTGLYEKKSVKLEHSEYCNEPKPEDISFKDNCPILQEPATTVDIVEDQSHQINVRSNDSIIPHGNIDESFNNDGTSDIKIIDACSNNNILSKLLNGESHLSEQDCSSLNTSEEIPDVNTSSLCIHKTIPLNNSEVIPLLESDVSSNNDDNSEVFVLPVNSPVASPPIQNEERSTDTIITGNSVNRDLRNNTSVDVVESGRNVLGNVLSKQTICHVDTEIENDSSNSSQIYSNTQVVQDRLVKWQCKTCGANTKTKNDLLSHIYNTHLKDDYEIKIKCKNCNFECENPSDMQQHNLSHEISTSAENDTSKLSSQNPLINNTRNDALTQNTENLILEISESDNDLGSETTVEQFQCFLCNYKTNNERLFRCHVGSHSKQKFYCEDHFWSVTSATCTKCIFENMLSNKGPIKTCKDCGYSTTQMCHLRKHFKSSKHEAVKRAKETELANLAYKKIKIQNNIEQEKNNYVQSQNSIRLVENCHNMSGTIPYVNFRQNKHGLIQNSVHSNDVTLQNSSLGTILLTNFTDSNVSKNILNDPVIIKKSAQNKENILTEDTRTPFGISESSNNLDKQLGVEVSSSIQNVNNSTRNNGFNITTFDQSLGQVIKTCLSIESNSKKEKTPENSDSECQIISALSFKCFDCNTAVSGKYDLQIHALSHHPNSSFKCDLHKSKINFYECDKCVYELIFRKYKKKTSDGVTTSETTRSKRKNKDEHTRGSKLKRSRSNKAYFSDSDTDTDSSVDIDYTEMRITRAKNSRNSDLAKGTRQINKTLNTTIELSDDVNSNNAIEIDDKDSDFEIDDKDSDFEIDDKDSKKQTTSGIKCFDCNFVFIANYRLKYHIGRHLGSKFQCLEHWKDRQEGCVKCYYEFLIQNVVKEVHCCKTCGYRTMDKNNFNRHISKLLSCKKFSLQRNLSQDEMLCFECQYVTTDKQLLKYHMVDHLNTQFYCKDHPNDKVKRCLKCIHEQCLENAKKEVLACEKCEFKTVNKEVLKIHYCTVKSNNLTIPDESDKQEQGVETHRSIKKYTCFDCDVFTTDTIVDLKKHATLHYKSQFQCEKHYSEGLRKGCSQCMYQRVLKYLERDARNKIEVPSSGPLTEINYKEKDPRDCVAFDKETSNLVPQTIQAECFDCKYFTADKKIQFPEHICRHIGSKFQCIEHWDNKIQECPKCYYEMAIQNFTGSIYSCNMCGYISTDMNKVERHNENKELCKKWSNRKLERTEILCFKCRYTTMYKKFLKYHMVDHLDQEFSCETHQEQKNIQCIRCINEISLESAKKEVLICKECSFKTVIKQIFGKHKCIAPTIMGSKDEHTSKKQPVQSSTTNNEIPANNGSSIVVKNSENEITKISANNKGSSNGVINSEVRDCEIDDEDSDVEIDDKNSDLDYSVIKTGQLSNNHQTRKGIKCLDCNFFCVENYRLRYHICRHHGSKFQCIEHWKDKLKNCVKCYYELLIQNIAKEVYCCKTCGYRTLHPHNFNKHMSKLLSCKKFSLQRRLSPDEILCFECQYVTSNKELLKYHMVDHLNTNFLCKDHPYQKEKRCLKCIHEQCLENAKKEVVICEKCKLKTVNTEILKIHDCSVESNNLTNADEYKEQERDAKASVTVRKYRCFDCDMFTTDTIVELKKHATLHYKSKFQCEKHYLERLLKDCSQCIYQKVLKYLERDASNKVEVSSSGPSTEMNFTEKNSTSSVTIDEETNLPRIIQAECFDCKYFTADKKSQFPEHICRHIGSKFQCIEHWDDKLEECPKCYYEMAIQNFTSSIYSCKICGYVSTDMYKIERHNENKELCKKWSNRKLERTEIMCFKCRYTTIHKKFLKYHMVDHLDQEFSCETHEEQKNVQCVYCINEISLESAKKEVLICKECSFKTVIKQIFRKHKCNARTNTGSKDEHTHEKQNDCIQSNVTNNDSLKANNKFSIGMENSENQIYTLLIDNQGSSNDVIDTEVKCFDCTFSTAKKNKNQLKDHVCCHIGSKFQCLEHWDQKSENCQKCYYEILLRNAVEKQKIVLQQEGKKSCKEWSDRWLETQEITCFTCQYITNYKTLLKYHMVDHLDEKFSCEIHQEEKNVECIRCINEISLETAKKEVLICQECSFKTVIQQVFEKHKCSESNITGSKDKHTHEKQDESVEFDAINNEVLQSDFEFSTCAENSENQMSELSTDKGISNGVSEMEVQCFDCKFTTTKKNENIFKDHVCCHVGSKFQCLEHWDQKSENCQKCYYEILLQNAAEKAKIVLQQKGKKSSEEWSNRWLEKHEMACFKCQYITNHKKLLQYHMVDHLDEEFSCEIHQEEKVIKCIRCINEISLENAKKKVLICKKCGFKTIIQQIFERHKCNATTITGSKDVHSQEKQDESVQFGATNSEFLQTNNEPSTDLENSRIEYLNNK